MLTLAALICAVLRASPVSAAAGDISTLAAETHAGINIWGVAVDAESNVYYTMVDPNAIKKLWANGSATVFAGTLGVRGNSGDGGLATSALLSNPAAVAVHPITGTPGGARGGI